jgi:hypothetical protein
MSDCKHRLLRFDDLKKRNIVTNRVTPQTEEDADASGVGGTIGGGEGAQPKRKALRI